MHFLLIWNYGLLHKIRKNAHKADGKYVQLSDVIYTLSNSYLMDNLLLCDCSLFIFKTLVILTKVELKT